MRNILFLLVVFSVMSFGCVKKHNETGIETVKRRAAFDFNCPEDQIEVVPLDRIKGGGNTQLGARGCNQRAVYVYVLQTRTWILNSDAASENSQKSGEPTE